MEMTPMKHRVAMLAVAALVVAACGGEAAVETTAAPDVGSMVSNPSPASQP